MAAFASGRRSSRIRFFVVLLALIMAFSAVALPVYALSESVALFGLAAVLSSATAALGFKLTNNQQGIDTINRMCADFVKSALAPTLVVIGTRANGLQNDMAYIKMQVKEGKTYLDSRVLAWVQQWLSNDGVYSIGTIKYPDYQVGQKIDLNNIILRSYTDIKSIFNGFIGTSIFDNIINHYNLDLTDCVFNMRSGGGKTLWTIDVLDTSNQYQVGNISKFSGGSLYVFIYGTVVRYYYNEDTAKFGQMSGAGQPFDLTLLHNIGDNKKDYLGLSSISQFDYVSNNTGLTGEDTIGEDYKDKTLEQILQGLKDHAPDWYDAGADSSTNSTVGAKDLPVTVPAGAATENPALNPDAVYTPPFDQPLDDTRSGATSSTAVADGVTNANTAESSEAAASTVSETQTIIDSLINWANNYISPDKGLFSKFPLCIPYDVYLLVSSALGVDARNISDIVNADTADIGSLSNDSTAVNPQSDFVPVVDVQHDFNLDGYTYPIRISFDLTPYEPLIKINRIFLSIALIAELIGSEYKRIRWGK